MIDLSFIPNFKQRIF